MSKKALCEISVEGKKILGQGDNAIVYSLDDETIIDNLMRPVLE